MRLIVAYRKDLHKSKPVPCYADSYVREFKALGHEVLTLGDNQDVPLQQLHTIDLNKWDMFLDIDNGRNPDGSLPFSGHCFVSKGPKWAIPTAVIFTDALALDTPIFTTKGWKTIGDIQEGDMVYAEDGHPTRVKSTSPLFLNRTCYKLKFEDGTEIVSDKDHRWKVEDTEFSRKHSRDWYTEVSTEELFIQYHINPYRYQIDISKPIDIYTYTPTIKPYTLGIWLGDGNSHNAVVTSFDEEVRIEIEKDGYTTKVGLRGAISVSGGLFSQLRVSNLLRNKHIPDNFFCASFEDRLSLLQGLLDSDGECAKDGTVYFHNKNENLVDQVKTLIASLGFRAIKKEYIRTSSGFSSYATNKTFRLAFTPSIPMFRIKRKLNRQKITSNRKIRHRIINIEQVASVPTKCLEVESNCHTFLVSRSFIPTHNSHGQSTLHHRLAPYYTHVFFAVWSKRDIFAKHKSAHFLPNATDLLWFGYEGFRNTPAEFDFGFFGSKNGLDRADPMIEICTRNKWTFDVRQLAKTYRPKWPHTGEAMRRCRNLFNRGQKLDINLRIFESGAMKRPLICDFDRDSGLDLLFEPYVHFIPYNRDLSGLEEAMSFVVNRERDAIIIADNMYEEIKSKHLIKHRVQSILEIIS